MTTLHVESECCCLLLASSQQLLDQVPKVHKNGEAILSEIITLLASDAQNVGDGRNMHRVRVIRAGKRSGWVPETHKLQYQRRVERIVVVDHRQSGRVSRHNCFPQMVEQFRVLLRGRCADTQEMLVRQFLRVCGMRYKTASHGMFDCRTQERSGDKDN